MTNENHQRIKFIFLRFKRARARVCAFNIARTKCRLSPVFSFVHFWLVRHRYLACVNLCMCAVCCVLCMPCGCMWNRITHMLIVVVALYYKHFSFAVWLRGRLPCLPCTNHLVLVAHFFRGRIASEWLYMFVWAARVCVCVCLAHKNGR